MSDGDQLEQSNVDISFASQISNELINELMCMLKAKLKKYNEVAQLFIIQYTYFELENENWIMKTFLDIGKETLDKIYLSISDDNTYIFVYSHNSNYGVLKIKHKLDMLNKSGPFKIYACDLYYDFEPQHYIGKCYTGHSY